MITLSTKTVPVLSGRHSSLRIGIKAKELGMKKVAVVYDKGVYAVGLVEPIIENLEVLGIKVVKYDGVLADPPDYTIEELAKIAKEEEVDGFIAVGGGSTMDTVKAANLLVSNGGELPEWYMPGPEPTKPFFPMIAIPTTPATGSEVTKIAVVTNTKKHQKDILLSEKIFFDLAIVDPMLQLGLPAKQTAYSAFDVITHAVDAIVTAYPEAYTRALAEKALRTTVEYLPRLLKDLKNIEYREELAVAATMAGNSINLGVCHATHTIGHTLGSKLHIPHGLAVSIGLPTLIEKYYSKWQPKNVRVIADCCRIKVQYLTDEEVGTVTARFFRNLIKESGVETLSEIKADKKDVYDAIDMMMIDATYAGSPVLFTKEMYTYVIDEAYKA